MSLAHEMFENGMNYQDIAEDFETENAKLREESSKYHDLYVHAITDAEVWHLQWSAEHQENAKLRKELEQWHRLTAGIELPEDPVTEFHPKNLERENAELRELAVLVLDMLDDLDCSNCPKRRDCDDNNQVFCDKISYHAIDSMREIVMGKA